MNKLKSIFLQTNTACNASCKICPYVKYYKDKPVKKMSLKLLEKILTDLTPKYYGEIGFYFQYEPLCDKRLAEILKLAKILCPCSRTVISTNAASLNKVWRQRLVDCKSLDVVYFNILGGNEETYEKMMPPLKWDNMMNNVWEFSKVFKGKMYVNFIKTNENKDSISELVSMLPENVSVISKYWASDRAGAVKIDKPRFAETRYKNKDQCLQLNKNVFIYYDGKVPLCCHCWNREVIIGDLNKENIYDLFESDKKHFNYKICKECD